MSLRWMLGVSWVVMGCNVQPETHTLVAEDTIVHGSFAAAVAPPHVEEVKTVAAKGGSRARMSGGVVGATPLNRLAGKAGQFEGAATLDHTDGTVALNAATATKGPGLRRGTRSAPARGARVTAPTTRNTVRPVRPSKTRAAGTPDLSVDTSLKTGLSGDQIWQTIASAMGQVRACYERSLKADPDLQGKLLMRWEVQPDGTVADAKVQGDGLGNAKLSECIERRVSRWRFPTASRSTPVEFPFTLRPSN